MPGTGSSITSTITVSAAGAFDGFTALACFRGAFFAAVRLGLAGLAPAPFAAFLRKDAEDWRAFPRTVARFLGCTRVRFFCLAMIGFPHKGLSLSTDVD
jgi:hypothetical protein